MSSVTAKLVDTRSGIVEMLNDPAFAAQAQTPIAVDLEGVNLCRQGTACIMQLYPQGSIIYLVDLVALGRAAFDVENEAGQTVRKVLENSEAKKVRALPCTLFLSLFYICSWVCR